MGKLATKIFANEIVKLAEGLPERDKLIFLTLYETSAKTSELIQIKISDIYSEKIKISGREIQISANLSSLISDYIKNNKLSSNSFLFSGRQSEQLTTKRIRQIIQSATNSFFGKKLNPEKLRQASIQKKLIEKPVSQVKKEAGLKRLDKREFLSEKTLISLKKQIQNSRDKIIFNLLLSGLKSTQLTKLKVSDVKNLNIPEKIKNELEIFVKRNKLSRDNFLFLTRQNSSLTKERIFQIVTDIGAAAGVVVSPRLLNNTALAAAINSSDENKLFSFARTRAFHLQGGLFEHE